MTDGAEVKICMGCYTLGIETTWALGKGCMLGGVAFFFRRESRDSEKFRGFFG